MYNQIGSYLPFIAPYRCYLDALATELPGQLNCSVRGLEPASRGQWQFCMVFQIQDDGICTARPAANQLALTSPSRYRHFHHQI